ncbi:MAG: hypothetical protein ACYCUI_11510 [Vulcanimicrobiaceae bacterium]
MHVDKFEKLNRPMSDAERMFSAELDAMLSKTTSFLKKEVQELGERLGLRIDMRTMAIVSHLCVGDDAKSALVVSGGQMHRDARGGILALLLEAAKEVAETVGHGG